MREKEKLEKISSELSELSKKYNVVFNIVGGIRILPDETTIKEITYSNEANGDMVPTFLNIK